MGSQFVDLNADGHIDYLTATFDGSPHVSYGSPEGFTEPTHLEDAQGRRIIISTFYNHEKWTDEDLGYAMPDGEPRGERCISAWAFDWDGDGDYDLLLGSYENGHLYRQMNAAATEATKGLERSSREFREKWMAVYEKYQKKMSPLTRQMQELNKQLGEYVASSQRETFVWLYERL